MLTSPRPSLTTRSVCSIWCSLQPCLWPTGGQGTQWKSWSKQRAEPQGSPGQFLFFLISSRENTTFSLFSEHSCYGLGRSTRAQECSLSDHKARASRSGNSSYSVLRNPNPSTHRALPSLSALGTADSQLPPGLADMNTTGAEMAWSPIGTKPSNPEWD